MHSIRLEHWSQRAWALWPMQYTWPGIQSKSLLDLKLAIFMTLFCLGMLNVCDDIMHIKHNLHLLGNDSRTHTLLSSLTVEFEFPDTQIEYSLACCDPRQAASLECTSIEPFVRDSPTSLAMLVVSGLLEQFIRNNVVELWEQIFSAKEV